MVIISKLNRIHRLYLSSFLLATLISQQTPAANLHEVYVMAEKSDPQYKQAVSTYRATLEQRPQALSQLLPNVNLNASTVRNEQDIVSAFTVGGTGRKTDDLVFNSHDYVLSLTQPLFRWDRFLQFRQVDSIIQQADAELISAKQDLMIRVAERYFAVLGARDNLAFARAEKRSLSRQLDQAKQRFEVGLTAITDVQEAQAGYDRSLALEIEAENEVDNTQEDLREIIGDYLTGYAELDEAMPLLSPEPESIESWTETAMEQSLDIISALYAVDTARDEVKINSAGHYPTLDFTASTGFNKSGGRFGDSKVETSTLGLQLNVPIFQGGFVNSRTREAVERLNVELQVLEQARRSVYSSTRQAYLGVLSGISQVKAFKQALVSSETALQATVAGFEVGTRTAVDVVTSERATLQARRDYSRARYDYLLETLRLKRSAGILAEEDLVKINQWLQ